MKNTNKMRFLGIFAVVLCLMVFLGITAFAADTETASSANVAKVGNTEYATIDEAIANWTNGSTLTLLADVTLSDVIALSSTEYHVLDLGTFTMTAASRKDAIQIVNNGRSKASYALDIKADANNPGGITASGKAVVRTTGKTGVQDRPIIRFYNGIFTGSNVVSHSGSNGTNCPQFWFYGGEFNGTVYANRALFQIYGGTFNGNIQISVDSSAYALVAGGRFKKLSNLYGSSLNSGKFTIGSAKGVYDRGIYVDKDGYYVITSAPITEVSAKYPAVKKETYKSNNYFYYSAAATYGMFYEVASMAGTGDNVTIWVKPAVTIPDTLTGDVVEEIKNNTALKGYTPENLPAGAELVIELTTVGDQIVYDVTPMANGAEVEPTEAITFRLPVPASVTKAYAKVYHDGEYMGTYAIQGEGNAKYVEISSADFSEYAVEPTVVAAKIGDACYETVQAAINAAQNGEVVTILAGEFGAINISNKNITIQGTVGANGELLTTIKGGNPAITGHGFNGTIKDIKIVDAWKVMYAEPAGNVTVDNVYVTGATYGFHLVAYSTGLTWTIQNSYMDLSWANSFGVSGNGDAAIVIKDNEFASTSPYYPDKGANAVNTFLPNVTIEGNIFGANTKILIRDSITDTSKINISKNYHADGVENAFADGSTKVEISKYYTDAEFTELVNTKLVAQVGDDKYESFLEALKAAIDSGASEIKVLKDVREKMTVDFDLVIKADLTITADAPVKVEFYNVGTTYDFAVGSTNNNTLTIGKNVSFDLTDRVIWVGYFGNNVDVVVDGYLGGYQIWHGADTTVTATGTLDSHGEAFIMRRNATLTVNGGKVNANYFHIYSGHIDAKNATITAGLVWINNNHSYGSEGTVSFKLNNTSFTSNGEVKVYAGEGKTVPVTLTNGSTFTAKGALTLGANTSVVADASSDFVAKNNSVFVATANGAKYTTLADAIAAAQAGATIKLLSDITVVGEKYTVAGKKITLDMNGKKITATDNKTAQNTTEGNYELFYINGGEMVVTGNGTIELTATTNRAWNAMSAIFHNRGGVLTIKNGTFTHNGGTDMAYVVDNSGNWSGVATTNIEDGTLTSAYIAIRNRMDKAPTSYKVILNISGGTINGVKRAIWAQASSTDVNNPATGEINIYGGKIGLIDTARSAGAVSMTTITGGTVASFKGESGELKVNGGKVSEITICYADGTEATRVAVKDKVYYAAAAVSVGKYYATLEDAVKAAKNGALIQLLCDSEGNGIVIDKNLSINFNGYTYTFSGDAVGSTGTKTNGFQVLAGVTLELRNGALKVADSAASKYAILIQNYGTLGLTGMTLDGTNLDYADNISYTLSINSGKVQIKGAYKTGYVTTIIANDRNGENDYAWDLYDYSSAGYALPTLVVNSGAKLITEGEFLAAASIYSGKTVYYATVAQAEANANGKKITVY